MASDKGLTGTPFENPVMPTPAGTPSGDGALTGGYDMGEGSRKETPNMSDLPLRVDQPTSLPDQAAAQANRGDTAAVADGVVSPMTPAGNIDKK